MIGIRSQLQLKSIILLVILLHCCLGKTAEQWKSRTIYQVLTDRFARNDGRNTTCTNLGDYCGGGYKGLTDNLDYIQGMGFDAIWISPIIQNYEGGYHGYKGRNIYGLNQNFGTENEFLTFINQCHKRDIWVMVDVVANHMGNLAEDFQDNVPFNSSEHFHDYCIISDEDFATKNMDHIQNCRLARLADIKQENAWVKDTLLAWIKDSVSKYKIDGLRIDTVPEVPKWFWSQFSKSAGVYTVGEVFDGDMGYVGGYTQCMDAVLNYPLFFTARDTLFNQRTMYTLRSLFMNWGKVLSSDKLSILGNFVQNHDNARVLSWSGDWQEKKKHYKTLNALCLTSVGIPIIYYGTQQYFSGGNDPQNRQVLWNSMNKDSDMYIFLSKINAARKKIQIWNYAQVERYCDDEIFAYSRGKFLVLLTNKVSGGVSKFISYHPFTAGQVICNIFFPDTDCITVTSSGFSIYLLNGQVKIYISKN